MYVTVGLVFGIAVGLIFKSFVPSFDLANFVAIAIIGTAVTGSLFDKSCAKKKDKQVAG
jgi:small basic protein